MNALEVEHLVKRFGTVTDVDDVTLTVFVDDIYLVVCPGP
jgi:ABC-type branched-subunit amino acid transport system ATPase component